MSQVDPRFLQARKNASKRRRRKYMGTITLVSGAILIAAGLAGGWWFLSKSPQTLRSATVADAPTTSELSPELGLTSAASDPVALSDLTPEDPAPRRSLDLPGDPMLLHLGTGGTGPGATRRLPRPTDLATTRGQGDILALRGPLLAPGERLSVTLPSSQEDFAIFQAQRRQSLSRTTPVAIPAITPQRGAVAYRSPGSAAEAYALLATRDLSAEFAQIGANALRLRPAETRQRPWQDSILRIERSSDLAMLLQLEGLEDAESTRIAAVAQSALGISQLQRGQILALRQSRDITGRSQFAQLALYEGMRYLGALARQDPLPQADPDPQPGPDGNTDIGTASDPWLHQDLPALIDDPLGTGSASNTGAGSGAAPRVMDALYAAGLRHGLSPGLVGQIIMLLAQTNPLEAEAGPDDSLILLYSPAAAPSPDSASPAQDLDQVLYIGLQAGDNAVQCHVFRPGPDRPPACYGPRRGSGPAASSRTRARTTTAPSAPQPATGGGGLTGGDAVEQLVNRIIQIESAGRADARNPNSSATGLGQFISSTWMHMMRVYRPDLVAQLSREALLDLRTDPDISREMVLNLAREGENYLRARGHEITAGRLYLAHFLGMDGAHVALSAPPETDLLSLFGASVINANAFLRGHDAGYVVDWAESRMRGASGRIAVIREPEGLAAFRMMINDLLTAL